MQFARALLMVLGLGMFAACGGDSFESKCKDGCSENDCDGNAPSASEVTACENSCADAVALNKASDCGDKADDLASACDGNSCSTDTNQECDDAGTAYFACVLAYCTSHTDDANCN